MKTRTVLVSLGLVALVTLSVGVPLLKKQAEQQRLKIEGERVTAAMLDVAATIDQWFRAEDDSLPHILDAKLVQRAAKNEDARRIRLVSLSAVYWTSVSDSPRLHYSDGERELFKGRDFPEEPCIVYDDGRRSGYDPHLDAVDSKGNIVRREYLAMTRTRSQ